MKDARTLATLSGKIFFFTAAVVLFLFIVVWPYISTPRRYEIKDLPAPQEETSSHPCAEDVAPLGNEQKDSSPSEDINEGEMVFNGKTQLIISPTQ